MPQLLRSNLTESKEEVGNSSIVSDLALVGPEGRVGFRGLFENKFLLGISLFSTLGGFLCGYGLGVLSNVLTIESFGATFPEIYMNPKLQGWLVSTFVLGKSTGPVCDKVGRKIGIICGAVIFLIGSSLQAGATSPAYLFAGRTVAGLAIGSLTHVVPMYLAEISSAKIRGSLISLQQLAITFGVNWIAYGTSRIGGTRCAPGIPYTGVLPNGMLAFNPYTDAPGGCTGQTQASWRVPFAFQILPALCLAIGMLFMPYSPRWLVEQGREEEALETLSRLRRKPTENCSVRTEFLEIMTEARFGREVMKAAYPNAGPARRTINKYLVLMSSRPKSKRIFVGFLIMSSQQNMALIALLPMIFHQLGLDPNTTSVIATGVSGIVNMLATLPAIALVDSVGRRPVFISGAAGCLICLTIASTIITVYGKDWPAHVVAARIVIVFAFLYDVIYSYSWAPMGWVVTSEIFPLHLRSIGMSIITSTMWSMIFMAGIFSLMTMGSSVSGIAYYVFVALSLGALLSAIFFIPETKGLTLEETDPVFRDNATDSQREHKEGIRQELGLPNRALLNENSG
ncbi:general substrate transporter [Suillus subalutaceus]|uniref:general substrate transporter n=1 Tax=Suillus subalutaceus TaxID=48586 RepID=UPI001B86A62E|nr:general substrate transporter [Suillus subalutaceus]KAG1870236.1 general substrate transporter [Suillus subalutaceus]